MAAADPASTASAVRNVGGARRPGASARALVPLALGGAILITPVPEGLSADAWRYFALFATVIAAIVTEPLAPALLGIGGVALAAALGLVRDTPAASAQWALSGFGNATVWLIFAAYMFTAGYATTGLGRRIALVLVRAIGHRTLGLGYAVTCADLLLAPFTASASARSAGTIYPVIRNIPELYGSRPDDGTARRIGAYLLYTALAVSFVTSSMFITGLAPNALAISIIAQTTGVRIAWMDWFLGFAPLGIVLLIVVPALVYWIYPPEIRVSPEVPRWAAGELRAMGPMRRKEIVLLALVVTALALWIGAAELMEPAIVAMLAVVLMVAFGVVTWDDVIGNAQAWNVLIWFATLVTLASGLAETGFLAWIAKLLAPFVSGRGLSTTILILVGTFFVLHYFFASITAHTATLLPLFLAITSSIPALPPERWALLFGYTLGLMGVLTPYAAGQNVIYYGSGYITARDFWKLGFILGAVYLGTYLAFVLT